MALTTPSAHTRALLCILFLLPDHGARTKLSGRQPVALSHDPTPEPPAGEQLKAALCCPLVVGRCGHSPESRLLQPQARICRNRPQSGSGYSSHQRLVLSRTSGLAGGGTASYTTSHHRGPERTMLQRFLGPASASGLRGGGAG